MTPSAKLGIASVLLVTNTFLPPYSNWRAPVNTGCYGIAFMVGVMAGVLGSKWWFVVPGMIVAGCTFALYIALHSY